MSDYSKNCYQDIVMPWPDVYLNYLCVNNNNIMLSTV